MMFNESRFDFYHYRLIIILLQMFRDENDEFMKSFGAFQSETKEVEHPQPERLPMSQRVGKKLRRYCENASFQLVSELEDEKSSNSKEKVVDNFEEKVESKSKQKKKINWMKQSMPNCRKFSDGKEFLNSWKFGEENSAFKMESIYQESESENSEVMDSNFDIPEMKEYHPPEEDPETYYMKKVRVLETKFKQINLSYQNIMMQLKKDKKNLNDELTVYKEFIEKYQPTLKRQIEQALREKQDNRSFLSSSSSGSSDKKSEDLSMPVVSQIMEVKIQGKKLCDTIKELTNKLRELEKKNFLDTKIKSESDQPSDSQSGKNPLNTPFTIKKKSSFETNSWMRKYSIPAVYVREKKQSFQTTVISERERSQVSTSQAESHSQFASSIQAQNVEVDEKNQVHMKMMND